MLFYIKIDNFKSQFEYNNKKVPPNNETTIHEGFESKSLRSVNKSDLIIHKKLNRILRKKNTHIITDYFN